ncbi:MAG: ABC transporter permease [Chthoniobacteraceae bacterium]|nr:ABC transporter permease [Chthoniobacteraceae bacterium]
MRTFITLLGREVKSFLYSPIAYVVLFFFLIATGFNFYSGVSFLNQGPSEVTVVEAAFNTVLFWFPFVLIFPLITMRTYADEFRMGTIETLATAPISDSQIVLSKFLGAFIFYILLWAPSFLYFTAFEQITGKAAAVAAGAYGGSYLLLLLLGAFYVALGCLASALTNEQINAAVMTFVAIFGFFVTGLLGFILNSPSQAVRDLISYFSAVEHMADFSRGLIDSRPLVWYISMTSFVLFLNLQVFQYRKWKA